MEEKLNTSALRALLEAFPVKPLLCTSYEGTDKLGRHRASLCAGDYLGGDNGRPPHECYGDLYAESEDAAVLRASAVASLVNAAPALLAAAEERDEARKIAAAEAHARHAAEAALDEALGVLDDGDETLTAEETARALVDAAREMRREWDFAKRCREDAERTASEAGPVLKRAMEERDAAREAHEDSYAKYLAADAERERLREAMQSMAARREMAERERDGARELAAVATESAQQAERRASAWHAELAALRAAVEGAQGALGWAWAQADAAAERGEDAAYATWRDRLRGLLAATKDGAR